MSSSGNVPCLKLKGEQEDSDDEDGADEEPSLGSHEIWEAAVSYLHHLAYARPVKTITTVESRSRRSDRCALDRAANLRLATRMGAKFAQHRASGI